MNTVDTARNYLRYESCYRVEIAQPYGQNERVNWPEATSEEEARSMFRGVISCRRATVEDDLDEFVETLRREGI